MGLLVALFVIFPAIGFGRFLAGRAFGIRGWKEGTQLGVARGRPALAFAQAGASIVCLYLACVVLFVPAHLGTGDVKVDETSMRVSVAANGPAQRAGIQDGDRIVGVNGEAPKDWDHLKKLVGAHPNETIAVDIERGGATKRFSVTTVGPKMMVGPHVERRRLGFGDAIGKSIAAPVQMASMAIRNLLRTYGGDKSEVAGPVAIAQAGKADFMLMVAAATSTLAALIGAVLLVVAAVMSVLPKRNSVLPTSGNSS